MECLFGFPNLCEVSDIHIISEQSGCVIRSGVWKTWAVVQILVRIQFKKSLLVFARAHGTLCGICFLLNSLIDQVNMFIHIYVQSVSGLII